MYIAVKHLVGRHKGYTNMHKRCKWHNKNDECQIKINFPLATSFSTALANEHYRGSKKLLTTKKNSWGKTKSLLMMACKAETRPVDIQIALWNLRCSYKSIAVVTITACFAVDRHLPLNLPTNCTRIPMEAVPSSIERQVILSRFVLIQQVTVVNRRRTCRSRSETVRKT